MASLCGRKHLDVHLPAGGPLVESDLDNQRTQWSRIVHTAPFGSPDVAERGIAQPISSPAGAPASRTAETPES